MTVGSASSTLTLSGDTATSNGTFTGTVSGSPTVAVYPENNYHAVYGDGTVDIRLASEIAWKAGEVRAPMLAKITSTANPTQGTAVFKHIAGLIKITYQNVPSAARSFTFTATTGIVGTFNVSVDGAVLNANSELGSILAFTFDAPVAEEMSFYVPVPCGTYAFEAALCDGNDVEIAGTERSVASATIGRGEYFIMPVVELEPQNSTPLTYTLSFTRMSNH